VLRNWVYSKDRGPARPPCFLEEKKGNKGVQSFSYNPTEENRSRREGSRRLNRHVAGGEVVETNIPAGSSESRPSTKKK